MKKRIKQIEYLRNSVAVEGSITDEGVLSYRLTDMMEPNMQVAGSTSQLDINY